jgi:hypothetical protein
MERSRIVRSSLRIFTAESAELAEFIFYSQRPRRTLR